MNASPLREQQDALLRALWSPQHDAAGEVWASHAGGDASYWRRGLIAYRSNAQELAPRALAGAYPVIAQLLGDDNFKPLAGALWRRTPPTRGDLAHWGAGLAALIASLPELIGEEPYLADVARTEWLLHEAASARDGTLDPASFQRLAQHDPDALTLSLCPGAAVLPSPYPVVSVINAHLQQEPALEEAGRRLRDGVAESALVWRAGAQPRLRECAPGEAAFVGALLNGQSLSRALQAAPELDLNHWLLPATQSGLLLHAALI